jgi:hypothetical protein
LMGVHGKTWKREYFQNWSIWRNISLKTANDKTDFAINNNKHIGPNS